MNIKHLIVDGICHKYRSLESDNWILNSINLDLNPGELVGLVGPSGCGKTTLLRLIAGFETPNKGKIIFNGLEVSSPNHVQPPERRGIGMVFQDYALFPHLDVMKNICFGIPRGSKLNRVDWLLQLLGISELKNRYPHELSGGQRQRVALARALAPGTSLILLDEPFCSLDQEVRIRLRNELSSVLKSCDAAALFVTHDSQEALAICDRVAVMNKGNIHQFSTPIKLVSHPLTPFVGKFVLQKNLLPINRKKGEYESALGLISFTNNLYNNNFNTIMFDSKSIALEFKSDGNATVKSREFMNDYWIITVKLSGHILRVLYKGDDNFQIGDSCNISFIPQEKVFLFPGSIGAVLI